jgi:hypothetical protein
METDLLSVQFRRKRDVHHLFSCIILKDVPKKRVSNSKSFTAVLRSITGCEEFYLVQLTLDKFVRIAMEEAGYGLALSFRHIKLLLYPTKLGVYLLMYTPFSTSSKCGEQSSRFYASLQLGRPTRLSAEIYSPMAYRTK